MPKFRKKPIVVEARQINHSTGKEIADWCGGEWVLAVGRGDQGEDLSHVAVPTLEGVMRQEVYGWIIKGVKGEFYPCKPDIFKATYEPVEEQPGQKLS